MPCAAYLGAYPSEPELTSSMVYSKSIAITFRALLLGRNGLRERFIAPATTLPPTVALQNSPPVVSYEDVDGAWNTKDSEMSLSVAPGSPREIDDLRTPRVSALVHRGSNSDPLRKPCIQPRKPSFGGMWRLPLIPSRTRRLFADAQDEVYSLHYGDTLSGARKEHAEMEMVYASVGRPSSPSSRMGA